MMTSYFHDAFNGCNRLVYCDSAAIYRQQLLYEQHQREAERDRLTNLQSLRDTQHRIFQSSTISDDVTNTPIDARSDDVTTSGGSPVTGRQLFPTQRHQLDWSAAAAMMECSRLRHQMTSTVAHHQNCSSTPRMDSSTTPNSTFYRTMTSSSVGGLGNRDHRWMLAPTVAAAGRLHSGPFSGLPTRLDTTSGFFDSSSAVTDGFDGDDGKLKRRTRSTSGDSSSDASIGSVNESSRNEDQHGNYHWMHVIGGHLFSFVTKLNSKRKLMLEKAKIMYCN